MTATPSEKDLVDKLCDDVRLLPIIVRHIDAACDEIDNLRQRCKDYEDRVKLGSEVIDRLRDTSNATDKSNEYEKNWKIVCDWFLCECAETNPATGEVVGAYARKAFNALCRLHSGLLCAMERETIAREVLDQMRLHLSCCDTSQGVLSAFDRGVGRILVLFNRAGDRQFTTRREA